MWLLGIVKPQIPQFGELKNQFTSLSQTKGTFLGSIHSGRRFATVHENNNTMIYILSFLSFMLVVAVIGIITAKINAKTPCTHEWHEDDTTHKCTKCNKSIPKYANAYSNAA
jgi:hypothetical protein